MLHIDFCKFAKIDTMEAIESSKIGKCKCCADHHDHDDCHSGNEEKDGWFRPYIGAAVSLSLLIAGLILGHYNDFFKNTAWVPPVWYFITFIPVGFPVIKEAIEGVAQKDYFNELTLMSIACLGAFCIGEYAEAVGVMLFYCIGETLQDKAVDKAKRNISKLLEMKAESARVVKGSETVNLKPEQVKIGEIVEVHPGEKVPLDGELMSENGGIFNTSALTGESLPREIEKYGDVLAGMISLNTTVRIRVTRPAGESAISRILYLVKNAQSKKAKSELFIRRFARIYTPVVTLLAVLVVLLPCFISLLNPGYHYDFTVWLYRALVFLVISCPCALVISVPLSYFAGIGAASRNGILFKGGNYLDAIKNVNVVAFDKTGTLTTGKFKVEKTEVVEGINENEFLSLLASAESQSNHPLAKAIVDYAKDKRLTIPNPKDLEEIAGRGIKAEIDGKKIFAGNLKFMKQEGITYPSELDRCPSTIVSLSIDGKFNGYALLADTIKTDALEIVNHLNKLGIDQVVMLSGDRKETVSKYADKLGIKQAFGDLLPEQKAQYVENVAKTPGKNIAFVGDGMNDAPVLAISNVGVAMGRLGADSAVDSADVVIQTDQPSRLATAIKIGKFTHNIVIQNVVGALVIKIVILTFDIMGIANLWWAVFADVGVTMITVLNSMRIMWKKY